MQTQQLKWTLCEVFEVIPLKPSNSRCIMYCILNIARKFTKKLLPAIFYADAQFFLLKSIWTAGIIGTVPCLLPVIWVIRYYNFLEKKDDIDHLRTKNK